jgi:hypothetical protein
MKVHVTNNDGRNTGRRLVKLRIHTKKTALWVVETCRHFGGTYCIQPQAFWWNLLLPTSGFLVEFVASNYRRFVATVASKFRRFHGTYNLQIPSFWWMILLQFQAFWLNVLLPASGVLVESISSNLRRFIGTYCF